MSALTGALRQALAKIVTDDRLQRALASGRPAPAAAAHPTAATPPKAPASAAITPEELLRELLKLRDAGLGDDVLTGFVRQRTLARELSADDVLLFRRAGLSDTVVKAVLARR